MYEKEVRTGISSSVISEETEINSDFLKCSICKQETSEHTAEVVRALPTVFKKLEVTGCCDLVNYINVHYNKNVIKLHLSCRMALQRSNATDDEVCRAGSSLLVSLYGGKVGERLADLRYESYFKLALSSFSTRKAATIRMCCSPACPTRSFACCDLGDSGQSSLEGNRLGLGIS